MQKFKDGNYWSPEKENYIVTLDEGLWKDANVDSSMYESISPYDTYVGKALEYYFEHLLPIPNSAIWMNTELLEHASEAFYDYKVKTALYKVGYKPCKKKLKNLDTDKWNDTGFTRRETRTRNNPRTEGRGEVSLRPSFACYNPDQHTYHQTESAFLHSRY